MIVFYHNKYSVTRSFSTATGEFTTVKNQNIVKLLLDSADRFKEEILVWCDESESENVAILEIEKLFHHKKMIFSFNSSAGNYLGRLLGYVEDSVFISVNKNVKYGSWQMSSQVGAVHASVLNACSKDLKAEKNFDYFLNSLAKRAMAHGLLCYSEPKLVVQKNTPAITEKANLFQFFKFTKQHYRMRWVFLLFFNLLVYEKRFPLLPFLFSLFYKRRSFNPEELNKIPLESNKEIITKGTIDVLIPTIGRRDYLLEVLNNLASQTHLPQNVIIVEQNPDTSSESELDFIQDRKWPFTIKHEFIHQSGACNARNIALKLIESEFTFFADDDIVFENNLLENTLKAFQNTGNEALLIACHLPTQVIKPEAPKQFSSFGTSHAFVKSASFKGLEFKMGFEFGFGEDNDFGMQLRNRGFDIIYISAFQILHLKAPMGGFRTKPVLSWHQDKIQPKPSPTVMLYKLLHDTKEQQLNYKTTIFLKNLNKKSLCNPFRYIKDFKQKLSRSIYWANELRKQ